jgi:SulP family sulfate permease
LARALAAFRRAAGVCAADFSWETVKLLVTPTLTIALLGAIESLLCARVADQLGTQPRKHDPNQELMAQGVANFVTCRFLAACRPPAPLPAP